MRDAIFPSQAINLGSRSFLAWGEVLLDYDNLLNSLFTQVFFQHSILVDFREDFLKTFIVLSQNLHCLIEELGDSLHLVLETWSSALLLQNHFLS